MKKLSFFLAISLATIVMFAGCKDKKPLKELTGTKWKSEDISIQMEGMPMAFCVEADFTTNKDVSFVIKFAVTHGGMPYGELEGTYTYSYPDIKVTTKDMSFEGKFSSKDQFSASMHLYELGDKTIVFNKIK